VIDVLQGQAQVASLTRDPARTPPHFVVKAVPFPLA
jgi:hypothetical protein